MSTVTNQFITAEAYSSVAPNMSVTADRKMGNQRRKRPTQAKAADYAKG